ncbi:hypothetical protein [Lacticaseibacillus paracasei]|uniref:hypothetical protein n=1 Tax=Lacticaseibacillus paracasei TaxID=1597 RepID=UPI00308A341D|nr:hypothetical protein SGY26_00285 [Lacticaseibacillus paracasei]WQG48256.1 hypothetical protein U2Q69_05750 [Lacticaseibacillus casei]
MKKHRFVIALVGLSLFAASSTIAADMTQANMDQHSVTYMIKGDGLVIFDKTRTYRTKSTAAAYKGTFAADAPTASFEKVGTLANHKDYRVTRKIKVKAKMQGAAAQTFFYVNGHGWVKGSDLTRE